MLRILGRLLKVLLLLGVLSSVFVAWVIGSESGTRWLVARLGGLDNAQIQDVHGILAGDLQIGRIHVQMPTTVLNIEDLRLVWSPKALLHRQLSVRELRAKSLSVQLASQSDSKPFVLDTLVLPLAVNLDSLHIDQLDIRDKGNTYLLHGVGGSWSADPNKHALSIAIGDSPVGPVSANANVETKPPFAISGQMELNDVPAYKRAVATVHLAGSLSALQLAVEAEAAGTELRSEVSLAPFTTVALQKFQADVHKFDLQSWLGGDLQSAISGQLQGQMDANGKLQATLAIDNETSGTIDRNLVPFKSLRTVIAGDVQHWQVQDLVLDLADAGRLTGAGSSNDSRFDLDLHADALNLHGVSTALQDTALQGPIKVQASSAKQKVVVDLVQADRTIEFDSELDNVKLTVHKARLGIANTGIDIDGEMALRDEQAFHFRGVTRAFDPSSLGSYPKASLSAEITLGGQLKPSAEGKLNLLFRNSHWQQRPLGGYATVVRTRAGMYNVDAKLNVADNKLQAQGSWGRDQAQLAWDVQAPELEQLYAGLHGSAMGSGHLSGDTHDPAGDISIQGTGLQLPNGLTVQTLNGKGSLAQGKNGKLLGELALSGIAQGKLSIDAVQAHLSGRLIDHSLALQAKGPRLDLVLKANGDWHEVSWRGRIDSLSNGEPYTLTLLAPAELELSSDRVRLSQAMIDTFAGRIELQSLFASAASWNTEGAVKAIAIQRLAALLDQPMLGRSDLTLDGHWNLQKQKTLEGQVELHRAGGDIVISGGEQPQPLLLQELQGEVAVRADKMRFKTLLAGERFGRMDFSGQGDLRSHQVKTSLWDTNLHADMPTLTWVKLFAPTIDTDGKLKLNLHARGTLDRPQWDGQLNGEDLRFGLAAEGVALDKGVLSVRLQQQGLIVDKFLMHGGDGSLNAEGVIGLFDQTGNLAYRLDKFTAVSSPDREATLSGTGTLRTTAERIVLEGALNIDKGRLGLNDTNERSLSKDIIIEGATPADKEAQSTAKQTLPMKVDLSLDLGENLKVEGHGVQADLVGRLQIRAAPDKLPQAFGTVYLKNGLVQQYGQALTIESGGINFDGAIDDPGLNIKARRKRDESVWLAMDDVNVYVQISGTASKPRVKLVSVPEVPDAEKLSWLILGHGLQGAQNTELDALSAAAGALFSSDESDSMQTKLANAIGMEKIGVRRDTSKQQTFATLGKQISSRAYLILEQALGGAGSLAKLRYQLTKRFSLQATAGTESALDLFYNWRFN